MNLQVAIPFKPCTFKCPFCIARNNTHQNNFSNLYNTDKKKFLKLYKKALKKNKIKDVILTGECDPSQDIPFLEDIIQATRATSKRIKIEIQTKCTRLDLIELDVDVIAYSIATRREFELNKVKARICTDKIIRAVVILSSLFDYKRLDVSEYKQVTFKTLQYGSDKVVNNWIKSNPFYGGDFRNEIINSTNTSIQFDTSCMDSTNRYLIFRCDGKIYTDWDSSTATK